MFKDNSDSDMRLEATRWELIIRTHAMPAAEPLAVDFAAPAAPVPPGIVAVADPNSIAPSTPAAPSTLKTPSR